MIAVRDIFIFVLINIIGFFAAPIIYHSTGFTGLFSPAMVEENIGAFQSSFFVGTMITWAVCAVMSIGFFFIDGKFRNVLIALPIVVPFIYGLNVLLKFVSVS